jgi:hypothetical protein
MHKAVATMSKTTSKKCSDFGELQQSLEIVNINEELWDVAAHVPDGAAITKYSQVAIGR